MSRQRLYYKAFRHTDRGIEFFMHGLQGSKLVRMNQWMTADTKTVRDGSGKRWYESGFHVFSSFDQVARWLKRVKTPVVIHVVKAQKVWEKERSPALLAEKIKVLPDVVHHHENPFLPLANWSKS